MLKLPKQATVALGVPAALLMWGSEPTQAATFNLQEASVSSINQAFDAGALTSEELVQLYLNRIEAYDDAGPTLNSLITVNPNALQTAAALDLERQTTGPRSVLHGIPIILKDNFDTFDLPTTGGFVGLADSVPPDDAYVVKQLRDAGAIILAKANLDEWAHGGAPGGGYSSAGGQTLNPYNLNRGPAGSSGGPAAAIAANFGTISLGTDTGGSIRGPAAANGLVGIKPTLGLTSRDGIIPFSLTLDTGGPLTRTVTDAAITLGFMTGIDPNDPVTQESEGKFFTDYTQFLAKDALQGARIGVARDFFGRNSDVDQAIEQAIAEIKALGATVVESVIFPPEVLAARGAVYSTISDTEFKAQIADYLETLPDGYPKTLTEVIAISQSPEVANSEFPVFPGVLNRLFEAEVRGPLTNPEYLDALNNGLALIKDRTLNVLNSNNLDAMIYPTSGCPAAPRAGIVDPTYVCGPGASATNIANLTGFPDVQVPAGFTSDGLPIALSFFGRAYSEPDLLGYAYAYEQATLLRRSSPLLPSLPGERIEYETVPEPGMIPALAVLGVSAFGVKFIKRRRKDTAQSDIILSTTLS